MVSAVIVERINIFVRFAAPWAARFVYKHSEVLPHAGRVPHPWAFCYTLGFFATPLVFVATPLVFVGTPLAFLLHPMIFAFYLCAAHP